MTPKLYKSLGLFALPLACSGATYSAEPITVPVTERLRGVTTLDAPKSTKTAFLSELRLIIFSGFNGLFGLCYAMDGGYKGWNPYIERHLAIFVNCFCSRAN